MAYEQDDVPVPVRQVRAVGSSNGGALPLIFLHDVESGHASLAHNDAITKTLHSCSSVAIPKTRSQLSINNFD
jgi:hypothetical protein